MRGKTGIKPADELDTMILRRELWKGEEHEYLSGN
jgi:hypothetical protein